MMMMMIPIVVTLVGIVTDVSDEHPINAELPNDRFRISINAGNDDDDGDDNSNDNTDSSNTSRNSNRRQR